ncbi:MAG: protoglobin domain-containing protein [Deferrisomatales bacterium]|nr:protoglobin domain-containing protein [Deferrisomatales bacterium]
MNPDPPVDRAARLRYLELTPADREQLTGLAAILLPHLDEVLEHWHGFLRGHASTAPLLANPGTRGHLREAQHRYFLSLLTTATDDAYFSERAQVGRTHHRVGLAPFWYLGAYRKLVALVRQKLRALGHGADTVAGWSAALEKVVTLDLAVALDAYQEQERETLLRSHRELERQMQQARESGRLKEEFLERISHQLRSPLHAMLGFADLVADGIQGPVTAGQRDSLAKVRVHGEHLVGMVDQLIDAATLAAAAVPDPQPFDPTSLLAEAAAGAGDAAALKKIRFTCALPGSLPQVLGDRRGTAVAVRQLLDNAVRFTTTGDVEMRVLRQRERLRIVVRDSGPGIPAGESERIFEPLHRTAGGDRHDQGPGLGLALAREAIVRNGGTLDLERTDATGSTFAVELPLAPGSAP